MRRSRMALIAVVSAVALSASILQAQMFGRRSGSGRGQPADPAQAAAVASDYSPMHASRGARQLLRNGLDYLDNYGDPERALPYLREAQDRQQELNTTEQRQLADGLARASQLLAGHEVGSDAAHGRAATVSPGAIAQAQPASNPYAPEPAIQRVAAEAPEPLPLPDPGRLAVPADLNLLAATGPAPSPEPAAYPEAPPLDSAPAAATPSPSPINAPAELAEPTGNPIGLTVLSDPSDTLAPEPHSLPVSAQDSGPAAELTPTLPTSAPALPGEAMEPPPALPDPGLETPAEASPPADQPSPATDVLNAPAPEADPSVVRHSTSGVLLIPPPQRAPAAAQAPAPEALPALPSEAQPAPAAEVLSPTPGPEPLLAPTDLPPAAPTDLLPPVAPTDLPPAAPTELPDPAAAAAPTDLPPTTTHELPIDLAAAPTVEPPPATPTDLPPAAPTELPPTLPGPAPGLDVAPVLPLPGDPAAVPMPEANLAEPLPPAADGLPGIDLSEVVTGSADPAAAARSTPAPRSLAQAMSPSGPRPRLDDQPATPPLGAETDGQAAAVAATPPAPLAEEAAALPPLPAEASEIPPRGTSASDRAAAISSLLPPGSDVVTLDNLPPSTSTLRPDTLREVEEIARRQEEENLRNPRVYQPGVSLFNEEADTGGSRINLPRAPSPTEARPIKPIPVPEEFERLGPRVFSPQRKYWAAPAMCHMPLYFQDAVLERYGQNVEQALGPAGRCFSYPLDDPRQSTQRMQLLQPLYSAGLFALQIAALPYNVVVDPPWESHYDLGFFRPGDPVPPDLYYLPTTGLGPPLHGKRYGFPRGPSVK